MMTAKEFWLNKFPDSEKDWGKTGHDDNFQVRMMEEYAKYYHESQVKKCDLADVGGSAINADELIEKLEKSSEYWKAYDHHRKYQDGLDKAKMMVIEMKNGGVKLM